jgi:hypothetical protein
LCNRAGGLIARVVESYGIATVNLSINLEISRKIGAPRAVFVKFPHGAALGEPGNVPQQLTVLRDLFWALQDLTEPGSIVEADYRWRRTEYPAVSVESFLR